MHFAHRIAGIGFAIGKDYLCLGMIEEHADKFTASVACCSKYAYSNHILICLCPPPNFVPLRQVAKMTFRRSTNVLLCHLRGALPSATLDPEGAKRRGWITFNLRTLQRPYPLNFKRYQ